MSDLDTRTRLLECAGQVFAVKGFKATTVRDVCERAGANLAAINYHFGDKERLYIEAVKHAHTCKTAEMLPPEWPAGTPPEQKLRDFVLMMLTNIVFEDTPAWHWQLILREMIQPTEACRELVRDNIRPIADRLMGIIRELVPADFTRERCYLIGFSVVGQIFFYRTHRPIAAILMGEAEHRKLNAEQLADHISSLVLAGLGHGGPITNVADSLREAERHANVAASLREAERHAERGDHIDDQIEGGRI